ncbi:hypothetical protein ACJMK2_042685, partial [Sinanodonta woodiana]
NSKRHQMENTTTNIITGGRLQQEPLTVASKAKKKRQTPNTNNKTSGKNQTQNGKNKVPDGQQRNGDGQMEKRPDPGWK